MAKKSTMRRGQMIAIAALFTSAVAPYAVSADTLGSVTTDAGTSRTTDVVTTSTEVTTTSADTVSTYVEKGVDYTVTASMDGLADRLKAAMVGEVNLRVDTDGKKYAQIAFVKSSYGFESFTDKDGKALTPISTTGEAGTTTLVRVIEVQLDEKYQGVVKVNAPNFGGEHTLTFDLAHEKFNFELISTNVPYFSAWFPGADVVTLKDGRKIAYIHLGGHSYGVDTIYLDAAKTKEAQVVHSKGEPGKDLTRTVRVEIGEDNKAALTLPTGERGDYNFGFDFTEKEAVANFVTAADVKAATALKVAYTAVDPTAGSWHPMAFPGTFTAAKAKASGANIHVVYTTTGDVSNIIVKQNGTAIDSTFENGKLSFTVASLEGLSIEADVKSARGEMTYKVNVAKAQADTTVTVEDFDVPAPTVTIPTTTDVVGKKATVTFKASSESLNTYFQKGFFGNVEIVEIGGQQYADLNIIEKSIGLEYDYIMADGTKADVAEISGNRATQNGNYEGFSAIIRIPVEVSENGQFSFVLDTFGGQPGTNSSAAYQFTFTGKIQNNVELPFTDIKNAATKEYVQQLANWGALNLKLNKFNPGNDLTRAQFSLMIARALDLKPTKETAFKDVASLKDKETRDAIQALNEAGIVNGTSKTTFSPGNKITRQQAAMMIYRLMTKQLDYKATATANDLNYNDASDIKSAEAQLAFAELQKAGVMTGSQGFINPGSNLTRGQMAKILVESLNKAGFEK